MKQLRNTVALVAGATRGAGRGIACMLGEAGATVYCTGRSVRGRPAPPSHGDHSPFDLAHRPETIDETAEMVTTRGGIGIAVRVDHTVQEQVQGLVERIRSDHGKLDVLVNDVWGGDALTEWGTPFWQLDLDKGFQMIRRAVYSHIITSRCAVPLMVNNKSGLIVEVTDTFNYAYKGTLFYDFVKFSVIRLAFGMAEELRPHGITSLAITPGFLRSEAMLDHFGVSEATWQEGTKKDPHFLHSETPLYVGRAVAALAADPQVLRKTGQVFSSWSLATEYGFTDIDGRKPDFGSYFRTEPSLAHQWEELQTSHGAFVNAMHTM